MPSLKLKPSIMSDAKSLKCSKGFTLMELVLVIIILGIMATGISGFISLSTQTYINATNRDGLISNARFVIERLNRELRNAVPNSIRIGQSLDNKTQCIEFVPIKASTVYIDIPVAPEPAINDVSAIPFEKHGAPYECKSVDGCTDLLIVYPLNDDEIYADHTDNVGKVFAINDVDKSSTNWQIQLFYLSGIHFSEDSPTNRLYIADLQVKYCVFSSRIMRYSNSIGGSLTVPGGSRATLMAEHIIADISGHLPFTYDPGTLTRNAVVQIHLNFTRNDENYVFDHEVHMNNVP